MKYVVLLGRILYALIFLVSVPGNFTAPVIAYAASQGVPLPHVLVPLSGLIALAGAVSVVLGYRAQWGAWLLVIFLLPVTFAMHAFWNVPDPQAAQSQMINFMKNVSMLGAALMIAYFGAGPLSLDEKLRQRGIARET